MLLVAQLLLSRLYRKRKDKKMVIIRHRRDRMISETRIGPKSWSWFDFVVTGISKYYV
jgi:hypothetical protein